MAVDMEKLQSFMNKMVLDAGAAATAPLILIGDRLGLYRAMAGAGSLSPGELAQRTGTDERYVREWLCAQAASGYVTYDPETERFTLPEEQALAFADEASPVFIPGMFEVLASMFRDEPKITEAFRTGKGVGWHEHDACLFRGTERFFRPGYNAHLVSAWIPALDGMEGRLREGGRVADIGCGHGSSTILMAQAFPNIHVTGYDYHAASIQRAREAAREAGLDERVSFVVASAQEFPGDAYDLVTVFDALHDMGDPVGAAAHVRNALAPDGTWMIVEPFAGDQVEENLNPVGRLFYAASTMICTPAAKSQPGGMAVGAQAGERRLREIVTAGGFTRFRRATETPFNMVFEAKP